MKKITFIFFLNLFSLSLFAQNTPGPISVTGFNADVIANGVGTMSSSTTNDVDGVNYCLIAEDWKLTAGSTPLTIGLPANGIITSTTVTGLTYQLQPAATPYDGNNSLRIDQSGAANSKSLTLSSPAPYESLYFLVTSGSGISNIDVVVHFSDATTETFSNLVIPDWFNTGLPIEAQGFGRGNLSTNTVETPTNNPKFFRLQVDIATANQPKNIASVEFIRTNTGTGVNTFNLFAISGQLATNCFAPTNLTASNIQVNSAELAWTEVGSATSWDIEYGVTGFTPTGTPTDPGVSNPFPLSGLASQTTYDFYVRADCGATDGTSIWTGPYTFTTLCDVFTAPFTEDFEATSSSINCWSQIREDGMADWTLHEGSSGGSITSAHSGTQNMHFVSENNANSPITKLVSPKLDLTSLTNPELTFFYGQEDWDGDQNQLKVYYRESPTDIWVELMHYTNSVAIWTQEVISLPSPTATYQVAFEGINYFGHTNVIDDVSIEESLATVNTSQVNFTYYPNPVKDVISIDNHQKNIEAVNFYTLLGKKVMSKTIGQSKVSLDINSLPSGVYFMEVQTKHATHTVKIVKE